MRNLKGRNVLLMFFLLVIGVMIMTACSSSQPAGTTESKTESNEGSSSSTSNTTNKSENDSNVKRDTINGYPKQPVNVLVGYAPGGGTDTMARSFIEALNAEGIVEQSFTVENLPGASGVKSFARLLQNPDDAHTLLAVSELGVPILNGALDADYSDFTPIAQIANDTLMIMVSTDSKYQTIDQLLDAFKADPKQVQIATSGALDSSEPFRWYTILEALGVEGELNIIPMSGTSESVAAVLGGHVDVILGNPSNAQGYIEAGKAKGLALLSKERFEEFPEVPTLVESGINIVHNRSRGVWVGAGVSDEIAGYWEEQFKKMMETKTWKEYLSKNMLKADFLGREDYKAYLQEEGRKFAEYIKYIQETRN